MTLGALSPGTQHQDDLDNLRWPGAPPLSTRSLPPSLLVWLLTTSLSQQTDVVTILHPTLEHFTVVVGFSTCEHCHHYISEICHVKFFIIFDRLFVIWRLYFGLWLHFNIPSWLLKLSSMIYNYRIIKSALCLYVCSDCLLFQCFNQEMIPVILEWDIFQPIPMLKQTKKTQLSEVRRLSEWWSLRLSCQKRENAMRNILIISFHNYSLRRTKPCRRLSVKE